MQMIFNFLFDTNFRFGYPYDKRSITVSTTRNYHSMTKDWSSANGARPSCGDRVVCAQFGILLDRKPGSRPGSL